MANPPASTVDSATEQDQDDMRDAIMVLRASHKLLDLSLSNLLRQLPKYFGQDAAKILHREVVWQIENVQESWKFLGRFPMKYVTRYTSDEELFRTELRALASLPGGPALALSAATKHDCNVYYARNGHTSLHGREVRQRDLHALSFCQMLVAGPEDECNQGCKVIIKARKQGLELENERSGRTARYVPEFRRLGLHPPRPRPRNAWFFKSMALLAEDHSRRTSFLLVEKVVDGKLPEELMEMIRGYYLEDKVEQMATLKEEYEKHWIWDPAKGVYSTRKKR
ncbi:hypothetical protein PRZ48_003342 [Zasmidium cellare]|uniref:Uncharacterized protein n=1 Tax=Zasmidium cellare TaxID=395010 RepID=A0ABR0EVF9_ZASCE|nr:hypothetical protein PRZ48_003342 [Zasmidium cellare]